MKESLISGSYKFQKIQIVTYDFLLGTILDYYIVYTVTDKIPKINLNEKQVAQMPRKNFFWCSSLNYVFSSLPSVSKEDSAKLCGVDCLFTGEYDTVLVESDQAP